MEQEFNSISNNNDNQIIEDIIDVPTIHNIDDDD